MLKSEYKVLKTNYDLMIDEDAKVGIVLFMGEPYVNPEKDNS